MDVKSLKNPMALIGVMIGIAILVPIVSAMFPLIVTDLVGLSSLGNFTFATLFVSTGVFSIILSAMILLGVLGYFGIKGLKGGR